VNTRRVVRVAVTRAPTQQWAAQQLRNATPFGQGPQVLIRDRDDKFGADFDRVAKGAGTRVLRTAVQAPLMNSVCERFLGSVRRECLDHRLILSEPQLKQVLDEYALSYFNTSRPHQGIGQRLPLPGDRGQAQVAGTVTAIPVLSGLHHDYRGGVTTADHERSQHSPLSLERTLFGPICAKSARCWTEQAHAEPP
jgi:putative transposase